jgi:N-acetylmuramoyl-L-alanine amidase
MIKFNTRKRHWQAAAAVLAAGCLTVGLIRPGAAAADGSFAPTFDGDTPRIVGTLVIPGKAAPETEPEPLRHGGLSDAEIYELKLDRWEAAKAAEKARPEALYTEEELRLLAIAIYCEAGSDNISDETRMMVAQVIINRVNDERFPDTIEEVLTQRGQYGRFYWTGVVWPSRAASEPEAVARAFACAKRVLDGEWPLPVDVVFQAEFIQGEIVASVPGFYFCR